MEFKQYRNERGDLHRIDGPAYINGDSYKAWFINGRVHRVDGPAYINGNYKSWYFNDEFVNPEDYIHEMIKDCIYET